MWHIVIPEVCKKLEQTGIKYHADSSSSLYVNGLKFDMDDFDVTVEWRTPTNKDWAILASHWQQGLNERIHYLENLRDLLTGCIGCGCLSMKNCPIYNENDKLSTQGTGPVLLNSNLSINN